MKEEGKVHYIIARMLIYFFTIVMTTLLIVRFLYHVTKGKN
jgi:hypothetical protein